MASGYVSKTLQDFEEWPHQWVRLTTASCLEFVGRWKTSFTSIASIVAGHVEALGNKTLAVWLARGMHCAMQMCRWILTKFSKFGRANSSRNETCCQIATFLSKKPDTKVTSKRMLGCLANILWNFLIQPESQRWHTHWAQLWRHMGLIGRNHRCDCWTKKGSASFGFGLCTAVIEIRCSVNQLASCFFSFLFFGHAHIISYVSKIMYEQNYAYDIFNWFVYDQPFLCNMYI